MSDLLKKRYIDPVTISDFAEKIQNTKTKAPLFLTVADIRAVGPGVWNDWKGELLRILQRNLLGFNRKLFRAG